MPRFPVSLSKEKQLTERMRRLGIREEDLEESFVRSSGAGGQNVNKTSTCVILIYRPTGRRIKCQIARSQGLNRFLARRLLLDQIEQECLSVRSSEQQLMEKIRRQKRRRSRRTRKKMLEDKLHQSVKKNLRAAVQSEEGE
jgi:protein subunit release factor B